MFLTCLPWDGPVQLSLQGTNKKYRSHITTSKVDYHMT